MALEHKRVLAQRLEGREAAIVTRLSTPARTTKLRILNEHRIKSAVDSAGLDADGLTEAHTDGDRSAAEEVEGMRGEGAFAEFYAQLTSVREYHARFPGAVAELGGARAEAAEASPAVQFSGTEVFGKYLDLHRLHEQYCNLWPDVLPEYIDYLKRFHRVDEIPERKKHGSYRQYSRELLGHLVDFFKRSQPLVDLDSLIAGRDQIFDAVWVPGGPGVAGWAAPALPHASAGSESSIDLSRFSNLQELQGLGMARLKEALSARGLKAGGTLEQRAERLWSSKGKTNDEIPARDIAKRASHAPSSQAAGSQLGIKRKADGAPVDHGASEKDRMRQLAARTDDRIIFVAEQIADVISTTIKHVEKSQIMSLEEKLAEIEEEDDPHGGMEPTPVDSESDGDDAPLYNPLNLPLGWDGKPIPYWLYKLHGLGQEFKCEVCGNFSYWGRRSFDKHFQEWRHAHGMRCLGIPNTKHFHDITSIADAISLYEALKGSVKSDHFSQATEEEFEDTEGNVLSRRTFEDLARQGLL